LYSAISVCYNRVVDERSFVEQKQDRWQRLSDALDTVARLGPGALDRAEMEVVGRLYREVVSDLSVARTQKASEELVWRLNDLAGRAHGYIYSKPRPRLSGVFSFFFEGFPRVFRSKLAYAAVSAIIFAVGYACGPQIVGATPELFGEMLPQGVGSGPTTIPDPAEMSGFLVTNNVKVGIIAFAGGITAGVLTSVVLFFNGVLLGVVAACCVPLRGQTAFWALILPHGIIELTAVFICGAAGLVVGSAIIAPGNVRRADAIRLAAGIAVQLFAGTLPLFIAAAIIEGFLTPSPIQPWMKLSFAGVTAVALLLYLGLAGTNGCRERSET